MLVLKHVDLVMLALALPIFLATGLPMVGYVTGAVAWIAQKLVKEYSERRALAIARQSADRPKPDTRAAIDDMRKVAGLTAGSMIGRGWLCALTIFGGYFAAGQDDDVGLAAAVLIIVCFTAYFASAMVLRPFSSPTSELPS